VEACDYVKAREHTFDFGASQSLPFYYIGRRRWRQAATAALLVWIVVYLICLFVVFLATDGP
jgi:hypothetical protein